MENPEIRRPGYMASIQMQLGKLDTRDLEYLASWDLGSAVSLLREHEAQDGAGQELDASRP